MLKLNFPSDIFALSINLLRLIWTLLCLDLPIENNWGWKWIIATVLLYKNLDVGFSVNNSRCFFDRIPMFPKYLTDFVEYCPYLFYDLLNYNYLSAIVSLDFVQVILISRTYQIGLKI